MLSFYEFRVPDAYVPAGESRASDLAASRVVQDQAAQQDQELQSLITQQIRDAVDIPDVFNKVAIYAGKLAPLTLAQAVHRIARYCRQRRQNLGDIKRSPRWQALLLELSTRLPTFEPQAITDAVWGLAVTQARDPRLLAAVCKEVFVRSETFSPSHLSITAWSLATLEYRDDEVMRRINRQALAKMRDFEPQSISNLTWSLATLRFKDDVLLHHVINAAVQKAEGFSAQHISNLVWAFTTLGRRAEPLFQALEVCALKLLADHSSEFCCLDLALCAWSYAWLEHADAESALLKAVAARALRQLKDFSSQQFANMLWGFSHTGYEDASFFHAIGSFCASLPESFWQRCNGEELVSICNALVPFSAGISNWASFEERFKRSTLRPLAEFLRSPPQAVDGYTRGLRQLRTYHAGPLYSNWLVQELGAVYMAPESDEARPALDKLVDFYLMGPEPKWRPDGYDADDLGALRCEIPGLLEMLEVKRRVQPSSHWIALYCTVDLRFIADAAAETSGTEATSASVAWSRPVPTLAPKSGNLAYVRGEKLEGRNIAGDGSGPLKTATLRDYERAHHCEVTAMAQIINALEAQEGVQLDPVVERRVHGSIALFVPHYPCASCCGAMAQFSKRFPNIRLKVGFDDWRLWSQRLRRRWDPSDVRHRQLSHNAKQLSNITDALPAAYLTAAGDQRPVPAAASRRAAAASSSPAASGGAEKPPPVEAAAPARAELPAQQNGTNGKNGKNVLVSVAKWFVFCCISYLSGSRRRR
eukprot:TRINITY_DN10828_c1_g2_i2.p1 TRINITY_DN10828_c1_g2~~TRINITY_DN10828_c1_g2_i2.p1  ORF type:complete len:761 (-),score=175.36 TRINITY_DN10828_c1_g2_i2:100-2382(-)